MNVIEKYYFLNSVNRMNTIMSGSCVAKRRSVTLKALGLIPIDAEPFNTTVGARCLH